jgi:hypothetical protein
MAKSLKQFLASIALDPEKLAAYIADPEGTLRAAGLPEADCAAVGAADADAVYNRLRADVDEEIAPPSSAPRWWSAEASLSSPAVIASAAQARRG